MDDNVVFENTPLAEYLEDEDEAFLSNWGIEPETRRQFSGFGTLPLMLNAESGKARLRRDRFRNLVRKALQATLSEAETAQFLERFRYAIVSSELLDGRVSIHHHQLHNTHAKAITTTNDFDDTNNTNKHTNSSNSTNHTNNERTNILLGEDGPWSIIKMQKKQHWVGGGGCIVVIVALLSWGVKRKTLNASSTTTVLVVLLCMSLYLFAHSRRRTVRLLRAKAVAYASHFVANNKQFDHAVGRCLSLILEVELLSQGYRAELSPAVGSGIDSRAMAKHLRSSLSAALYLILTSYLEGINEILPHCVTLDLMRYLDIYDVDASELGFDRQTVSLEISRDDFYGVHGANVPIAHLRAEFNKLHLLRRFYMCCLLSLTSRDDFAGEIACWSCAVHQLRDISDLVLQLSRTILNSRHVLNEANAAKKTSLPVRRDTDWRGHFRSLNEISCTLQHIEARLQVLSDTDDSADYYQNYEMVGTEIQHLAATWERGFKDLSKPEPPPCEPAVVADPPPQHSRTFSMDSDSTMGPFSSGTTLADGESMLRPFSPRMDMMMMERLGHRRTDTTSTASSMTIFQGIAEDDKLGPSGRNSRMSRTDRIKMMHQAREAEATRKAQQMTRQNFVNELDSVLRHR
ncbi:hypothetical protein TRVA0_007S03092 [Trichomonascus vanleenenianus]|uniref:uncharacterized protein n=1 Tax=Trichomonascus vanleenenianus TaxID=2268995 RepID=UPI003ECA2C7D